MATKIHIFVSHGAPVLFVVHAWGQDVLPWPIKKRKLYWRIVGQISVLKLNWHHAADLQPNSWLKNCQAEQIYGIKFVCRCEWAWDLRSQIMKVLPVREFCHWVSSVDFHSPQVILISLTTLRFCPYFLYISHLFPHRVFFLSIFKSLLQLQQPSSSCWTSEPTLFKWVLNQAGQVKPALILMIAIVLLENNWQTFCI